jgi:hypothetical protein
LLQVASEFTQGHKPGFVGNLDFLPQALDPGMQVYAAVFTAGSVLAYFYHADLVKRKVS